MGSVFLLCRFRVPPTLRSMLSQKIVRAWPNSSSRSTVAGRNIAVSFNAIEEALMIVILPATSASARSEPDWLHSSCRKGCWFSPLALRSRGSSLLKFHFLSGPEKMRCLIFTESASGDSEATHPSLDHASLALQS